MSTEVEPEFKPEQDRRTFWKRTKLSVVIPAVLGTYGLLYLISMTAMGLPGPELMLWLVFASPLLLFFVLPILASYRPGPRGEIFRIGYVLTNLALVLSVLGLANDVWTFATTSQVTRHGTYEALVYQTSASNDPNDPVNKGLIDASTAITSGIREKLPTGWAIRGPFEWDKDHFASPPTGSHVSTGAELTIPDSAIHKRSAIWIPKILTKVWIVLGLWWARKMLRAVNTTGPFDPIVYKMLRRIAILGLVAGFGIDFIQMDLLNDFYSQLALDRFGIYAERSEKGVFHGEWLVLIVVVELLRYGVQLQQENDATV